jgi:hypothetical protein
MDYFVIGGGAWPDDLQTNLQTVPEESLKFFLGKDGGFALIDVTAERMELSFIDSNGNIRYNYNLYPRK